MQGPLWRLSLTAECKFHLWDCILVAIQDAFSNSATQRVRMICWFPDFFCFCVHFCLIWIWERRNKFYHLKSANPRAMGLLGSCFIVTDWRLHIIDLLPLSTLREDRLYSLGNQNRQDGYDIGTFLTYLSYSLVAIAFHEKNEDTG